MQNIQDKTALISPGSYKISLRVQQVNVVLRNHYGLEY
jgi:hypothetical protein